jgi:hypothetical protein
MGKTYDYHRKHEYLANDFIKEAAPRKPETVDVVVDKQINVLYDMYVLKRSKQHRHTDPNEYAVRKILIAAGNEYTSIDNAENAMTRILKDLKRGNITVDQFIKVYGE